VTRLLALLKRVWAREPELVAALVPVAVELGFITQSQADALVQALTAVAAVLATIGAAAGARTTRLTQLRAARATPQGGSK
jgi:hypothetical protein